MCYMNKWKSTFHITMFNMTLLFIVFFSLPFFLEFLHFYVCVESKSSSILKLQSLNCSIFHLLSFLNFWHQCENHGAYVFVMTELPLSFL